MLVLLQSAEWLAFGFAEEEFDKGEQQVRLRPLYGHP